MPTGKGKNKDASHNFLSRTGSDPVRDTFLIKSSDVFWGASARFSDKSYTENFFVFNYWLVFVQIRQMIPRRFVKK